MRRQIYIIISLILIFLLIINYTSMSKATEQESNIMSNVVAETSNVIEQKNELQNKIDESTEILENVQLTIDNVSDTLTKLNEEILAMQYDILKLNIEIANCEGDLNTSQKNLNNAEKMYKEQKELLEKRLVSTYETGETVFLDVLLGSSSVSDFLSKFHLINTIIEYDDELLKTVEQEEKTIREEKINFEKTLLELEALKISQEEMAEKLEENIEKREIYLEELTGQELQLQDDIEKYKEELENLENEILRVSLSEITENEIDKPMMWPMPGQHRVTSVYGMRVHPLFGVISMHTGTDIAAPTGTPVVAANDGVVILATYSASYGNYIMVNHGGGYVTLYAHGSKLIAKVGDVVEQGDIIMLNGSTGWSTGPHLHFEIRVDGVAVDAYPYIQTTSSYIDE